MARLVDVVFFIYFLTHIPISLLVDFQAVLPIELYPKQLVQVKEWYCREYRDAMMMDPPHWFQSLCWCELFLQFPFFFVGMYAYFKGAAKCKWIRLPALVYGTHVATTLMPIISHVFLTDFSDSKYPGPRNFDERMRLISFYLPYLVIPLLIVADCLFSDVYKTDKSDAYKKQKMK